MSMPRFISGFRLPWSGDLNQLSDAIDNIQGNGTAGPISGTTGAFSGNVSAGGDVTLALGTNDFTAGFQTVTAAGATQGNATAITGSKAIITVALTASTKGVKLPTAATGLEVLIANAATFGVKIWPGSGARIGAAATNAVGPVLAINKATRFIALNTTRWVAQTGA